MSSVKQSRTPLWKKSMLEKLNLIEIKEALYEIMENGDSEGYNRGDEGYYNDYKEQFDMLAEGAELMLNAIDELSYDESIWNDITVGLLGIKYKVLGFDSKELDYFEMMNDYEEDWAVEEAKKRLMRMTKSDLIDNFGNVLRTLLLFFDLKASHDCLVSVVEELDERAAIMINCTSGNMTNRMWVE